MVLSKQALNKRILALENIWITINNIFNCLFFMQEHKQQRNSILKLSITDWKNRPGRTYMWWE